MTDQEIKKAKELSGNVKALFGSPKMKPVRVHKKVSPMFEYLKTPEKKTIADYVPQKELVYETPESIASKLNSLPEALGVHVIKGLPNPEDLIPLVIEALKNLKGNERLDISHIRNGEQLASLANKKFDMNDQRWHGGGSGGTTNRDVFTTTDNQTVFTATKTVKTDSQVFESGTLMNPTADYTVSGSTLTLTVGVPAGTIVTWYYNV